MPCDTLVYVRGSPSGGPSGGTLFGKNSDRPSAEAQEVVYIQSQTHPSNSVVRCTYITIPQVPETFAVVLSRPAWLWGCEMGANEHGVVGGNEAIHTRLRHLSTCNGKEKRLLGMDLLRLALERSRTAMEATSICAQLLETHGQGGPCVENDPSLTYENAFLFADANDSYVLETAGVRHWAWERVGGQRRRNISNLCSIHVPDACSPSICQLCIDNGWWGGEGTSGDDDKQRQPFDWAKILCDGEAFRRAKEREAGGAKHLEALQIQQAAMQKAAADTDDENAAAAAAAAAAAWWLRGMANVLRDEECGICFRELDEVCSTGSMLAWIPPNEAEARYFFTAASDPSVATYKEFTFGEVVATVTAVAAAEAEEAKEDEQKIQASLQLWHRWRSIALAGGLDTVAGETEASRLRSHLEALENNALHRASSTSPLPFEAAVERELELLLNLSFAEPPPPATIPMASLTSNQIIRVYVDMVGDLFHYGHMRFVQKVRSCASSKFPQASIQIVVGITADKYLMAYKRKPCTSNRERCETVAGCKFVDEVIPDVPLVTSAAFMDLHKLDAVFHGDDYTDEKISKYYSDVVARNAYFSVPYSSDAVSTTVLLRTAAARQAAFLAKTVSQSATVVTENDVTGFTIRRYGPTKMHDSAEGERLLDLLHLYGAHYANAFAPDMEWRLFHGNDETGSSGIEGRTAVCVAPQGTVTGDGQEMSNQVDDFLRIVCVSHACVITDDQKEKENVDVGLFGCVITDPQYRRRGLSRMLVQQTLQDWDEGHPNGYLVLGTGSVHAAKMYEQNGFVHLAGSLESGDKGYNPDDLGEWIMIRPPPGLSLLVAFHGQKTFDRYAFIQFFYEDSTAPTSNFEVHQLRRGHWTELCLLLNLDENDNQKLVSQSITTGVHGEEKLLKIINRIDSHSLQKMPMVCIDKKNKRVHGISVWDEQKQQLDVYTLPGMQVVRDMLVQH